LTEHDARRLSVTFGHGSRHLRAASVSAAEVEAAIAHDLERISPPPGAALRRAIVVAGAMIEYRAYRVDEARIHVGTYYPL
jgi:hypothetical protein